MPTSGRHFIPWPNRKEFTEWLLVRQPAQQINIKQYVYIALCIPHILIYIRVRVRVRLILYCFAELAAGPIGVAKNLRFLADS